MRWDISVLVAIAVLTVSFGDGLVSRSQFGKLAGKLKKLSDSEFYGMSFVLNITGEPCLPQWTFPKPGCWRPGWPWPWPLPPGHHKTTKRPGHPGGPTSPMTTIAPGQTTTTQPSGPGGPGTSSSTSTTTTTSTTTLAPTTSNQPTPPTTEMAEASTCAYDYDAQDDTWCRDIREASIGTGPLKDCQEYYDNATIWDFYFQCRAFQCQYQRAYRCYGTWFFVQNCSQYLTGDQSLYGWRADNACNAQENSTPFPNITFTPLPPGFSPVDLTFPTGAVNDGKRSADTETTEGTVSEAFGIKHNWCVPFLFSHWHTSGGSGGGKGHNGGGKGNSGSHSGTGGHSGSGSSGGKGGSGSGSSGGHGGKGSGSGGKGGSGPAPPSSKKTTKKPCDEDKGNGKNNNGGGHIVVGGNSGKNGNGGQNNNNGHSGQSHNNFPFF